MVAITTEQEVPFTFKITDGRGRAKAADGTPVGATSDATVATVGDLTDNGNNSWSGVVSSVALGDCRVSVTADADTYTAVLHELVALLYLTVRLDPRSGEGVHYIQAGTRGDT